MRTSNELILDGYSQTSGTAYSSAFRLENFTGYSLQIVVASQSSYGATASLEFSNDEGGDGFVGAVSSWCAATNTAPTANIALAADGSYMWNISGAYYRWCRVKLAWSAGSATVSVRANGKEF
jgi:hypothetical protein